MASAYEETEELRGGPSEYQGYFEKAKTRLAEAKNSRPGLELADSYNIQDPLRDNYLPNSTQTAF